MTEKADISAYENTDLTQLNTTSEDVKPTEERLEKFLIRVVFTAKVFAWIGIAAMVLLGLYGWTRNQTQDSWLMSLPMNIAGSPSCTWMNRGYDAGLRKDTAFRDYLTSKGKQSLAEYIDNGHCIAPDTIAQWLDLEKSLASDELAQAYEKIIPKKFLGTTITSSPELDVIASLAPSHRMQHDVVLQIISDTTDRLSDSSSRITCQQIRFNELSAEADCQVTTKAPIQPRAKAIDFVKSLSGTQSLLVIYPSMLDMRLDEKTNLLTTEFSVHMTYIPSRYEANEIKKLTYDQR